MINTIALYLSIICLPLTLQAMDWIIPKKKEYYAQQAWQHAFAGNFAKALENLKNASNKGCIVSTNCLAQQYERGGLLTEPNEAAAETYQARARTLRSEMKFHSQTYEEQELAKNLTAMNTWHFARTHPCFEKVLAELSQQFKKNILQEKPYYPPTPYQSLVEFLKLINQEPTSPFLPQNIQTFLECAPQLSSAKFYIYLLDQLKNNSINTTLACDLLLAITPVARNFKLQTQLEGAYSKSICMYDNSSGNRKSPKITLRLLKDFAAINNKKTLKWLDRLKKRWFKVDDVALALEVLLTMREANQELFEQTSVEIKHNYLSPATELLLKKPRLLKSFAGTSCSLESLFKYGFDILSNKESSVSGPAFYATFVQQANQFHGNYETELIAATRSILLQDSSQRAALVNLSQSSLASLRIAAFDALLEFIIQEKDSFKQLHACNSLLKINFEQIAIDKETSLEALYKQLYVLLKQKNNGVLIAKLWSFLLTRISLSHILITTVLDYFNIPSQLHKKFIEQRALNATSNAVHYAYQHRLISKIHIMEILNQAYINKCLFVHKNLYISTCSEQLFNTSMPLLERVKIIDALFNAILAEPEEAKAQSLYALEQSIQALEDGIFKVYAQMLLSALNRSATPYEQCQAQQGLHNLHQQEPVCDPEPSSIRNSLGSFYNAFKTRQEGQPEYMVFLKKEFQYRQITQDGLLYGFGQTNEGSTQYSKFYACDAATGNACWYYPIIFESNKLPKFGIYGQYVYLARDNGLIDVLDKVTGKITESLSFPIKPKRPNFSFFEITSNGFLYCIEEDDLVSDFPTQVLQCINLNTQKLVYSKILYGRGHKFCIAGEHLLDIRDYSMTRNTVESYNPVSSEPTILFPEIALEQYFSISQSVQGTLLLYQERKIVNDKKYHTLICYNITQRKQAWEIEIPGLLASKPVFSTDNKTIYCATHSDSRVLAINTNTTDNNPTISWCVEYNKKETDIFAPNIKLKLALANNNVLVGLEKCTGDLYVYDCQTGKSEHKGIFNLSSGFKRIIGTFNNKIYAQV